MTTKQHCVLYTDDPELATEITSYLSDLFEFFIPKTAPETLEVLGRRQTCIALVDLRTEGAPALVASLTRRKPGVLTVALGEPKSRPFQEAMGHDIFAVGDVDSSNVQLQALLGQAAKHMEVVAENQILKQQIQDARQRALPETSSGALEFTRIDVISQIVGQLHDPFVVLDDILNEISSRFLSTNVGLFVLAASRYALRSGMRCPEEAWNCGFTESHAFVRWMKIHGQIVSRKSLRNVEDNADRLLLSQTLDTLGADIIVPVTKSSTLVGWLALGKRVDGGVYEKGDHQQLLPISDRLATIVSALQVQEERERRQDVLKGLVDAIPSGLLLVNPQGVVSWANEEGRRLVREEFGGEVEGVSLLGVHSLLADIVHRANDHPGRFVGKEVEIEGVALEMTARPLEGKDGIIGTLIMIDDISFRMGGRSSNPAEKVVALDELAFRIRTALSSIRNYRQLVAEHHDDPEFLENYGTLVEKGINGLVEIADQLTPGLLSNRH